MSPVLDELINKRHNNIGKIIQSMHNMKLKFRWKMTRYIIMGTTIKTFLPVMGNKNRDSLKAVK